MTQSLHLFSTSVSSFVSGSLGIAPPITRRCSSILPFLLPSRDEKNCLILPVQQTRGLRAKPKRGSVVDSYQTVSVNCSKCWERLFRYKKKNGTKSNLIKCYIERISEDSAGVLEKALSQIDLEDGELPKDLPQDYGWECPNCKTQFARSAQIKGLPALKLVGGKVKMTKK